MKRQIKNQESHSDLLAGFYLKRDAASEISKGCHHLHSTSAGSRDPGAKQTQDGLADSKVPTYSWELSNGASELKLGSSVDRQSVIHQIISRAGLESKRYLREKVESVLEEMVSNALFHAYRDANGKDKYPRRSKVTLGSGELLTIKYQMSDHGIYLSVVDQAGTLNFGDVAGSLKRCYENTAQIQNKEGGAGLGTYMIFDAMTHLKFVVEPGKSTTVSCWIADQRSYDPENYSFNFFVKR